MGILSNTALAFSMSADAFAASVGKGVTLCKPSLANAVRIGLIFGIIETLTPLAGWLLGTVASRFIASIDHWVAFVILTAIGGHMLWEGWKGEAKKAEDACKLGSLVLTACGTSIDALAVGATLAFLHANIWITSLTIGGATFLMTTIGILTGSYIGQKAGRIAEILGGFCLIAIGTHILLQHLGIIS